MLRLKTEQKTGSLQLRPYNGPTNGPTNGSASRVDTTSRRYHSNNHTSSRRNAPVCKRYRSDCSGDGTVDEGSLALPCIPYTLRIICRILRGTRYPPSAKAVLEVLAIHNDSKRLTLPCLGMSQCPRSGDPMVDHDARRQCICR